MNNDSTSDLPTVVAKYSSTFLLELFSLAPLTGVPFLDGVRFGVRLLRSDIGVRGDLDDFEFRRFDAGDLEPLEFLRVLPGVGGPGFW